MRVEQGEVRSRTSSDGREDTREVGVCLSRWSNSTNFNCLKPRQIGQGNPLAALAFSQYLLWEKPD